MAAGSNNIKNPPVFHPDEDDDYLSWKADVEVWKEFTDTKVEKLGLAIYLALKGKAREAARTLKAADLKKEGGYELIIRELDKVFQADETSRAFCAFKEFYEYKRNSGEGFPDFIVEFEKRYNKVVQYQMELPEGVKAFFLLKSANLSAESEKLARAVSKLEYADMRDKLQKIFGDPGVLGDKDEVPNVKEEVFYGDGYDRGRGGYRGGYRGRGGFSGSGRGFNPQQNRFGNLRSNFDRGGATYRGTGRGGTPGRGGAQTQFRCFECDSTKHWANQCPHRQQRKEDVQMNVHVTLLNTKMESQKGSLLNETFGKGLLDSGCSKTVAGAVWVEEFIKTLSLTDVNGITEKTSTSVFRFGDGIETKSLKTVTIPVYIGAERVLMDVDVVEHDIPLLISKGAMKQLNMQLDFKHDVVTVGKQKLKLDCTSTGHYCLALTIHPDRYDVNFIFKLENLTGMKKEEMKSKAVKLHKQFSHASKEKLTKLLKDGGCKDAEFLRIVAECCQDCEVCHKHRKAPLKPIVCFPLATKFNEVVCMDLKEFKHLEVWILHLIDASCKYSAACLIKSKQKNVIVAAIFRMWIAYFGCPKKFLSDNGGEFANDVFMEMNEKLGVETATTAAESPFSNGIVERHNGILYEAMIKTIDETKCTPDMALAWSVSAKNALQNSGGYSPNQLVFGTNTNIPTVLSDNPPALESTTSSDIVRRNLEALHSARKNYIAAEASDKVRRALRHKVRTYADKHYEAGQKVYYKRKGHKGWRGPGSVIGIDGKTVLVRHGAFYYRCHPCHVMKEKPGRDDVQKTVHEEEVSQEGKEEVGVKTTMQSKTVHEEVSQEGKEEVEVKTSVQSKAATFDPQLIEDDSDTDSASEHTVDEQAPDFDAADGVQQIAVEDDMMGHELSDDPETVSGDEQLTSHVQPVSQTDDVDNDCSVSEDASQAVSQTGLQSATEDMDPSVETASTSSFQHQPEPIPVISITEEELEADVTHTKTSNATRPKTKSYIEYRLEEGDVVRAKVLSKQPKKTKYLKKKWDGDWINVQVEGASQPSSINWENVTYWKEIPEPIDKFILLTATEELDEQVIEAKEAEIEKLLKNNTFESVPYVNQSLISTKWVFTEKEKDGQFSTKARLVARGFEEDSSQMKIDSPTCSKQSLRMLFLTAATKRWAIKSIDIASAFLQGNAIEREVYLRPPKEYAVEGQVWKLNRCIYGLNDAPRSWYDRVKQVLIDLGGKKSKYDNALFCWYTEEGSLEGTMVLHVDDFEFCGTKAWEERVIKSICETFVISSYQQGTFKYVGLNVSQHDDAVYVDQSDYTNKLREIEISAERQKQKDSKLTPDEVSELRTASGQLLWAATQTRPDSSYDACIVANYGKEPTVRSIMIANKAIRKIRTHDSGLVFPNMGPPEKIEVIAYTDASHGALPSGASQGGCIIFAKGNGKLAPVQWQSRKLPRVPKSPLAAETMMIAETADAGFCVATMLKEIFALEQLPAVRVMTDSKSFIDHLDSSRVIQDTRMRVDMARIREIIQLKEAHVAWVPKEEQLADPLTKQGASAVKLLAVLNSGRQ